MKNMILFDLLCNLTKILLGVRLDHMDKTFYHDLDIFIPRKDVSQYTAFSLNWMKKVLYKKNYAFMTGLQHTLQNFIGREFINLQTCCRRGGWSCRRRRTVTKAFLDV